MQNKKYYLQTVIAYYEIPKKTPFLFNIFIVHGFNACPLFTLELHFESMFKIDPVTCGDQEYDTK